MNVLSICQNPNILRIIYFINTLINIVKFIVPIVLIVMVMLDLGKGVLSGEKKPSEILKLSGNKLLAAIIIFLLPTIVNFCIGLVTSQTPYGDCWENSKSLSIINNYQAIWDEEQAMKKEEEKKKREEEKRKEEEEALKKEEANANKIWNVDLTDINPNYKSKKLENYPNISINYYNDFTYWVYHPKTEVKNLPIVVFIGGLGHVGNDYETGNKLAIRGGPIDMVIKKGIEYNAILVTMQVPYRNSEDKVYKYVGKYITLLNKIADKFNADKNKISIMGFSHGCYGVMTIVNKNPKFFSAVVPVGCSWNQKNISSKNFIHQPVWGISGSGDGQYGAYEGHVSLKSFAKYINENGGNAKVTYLSGRGHDVFTDEYSIINDPELDVVNWMISQSKSS